MSVSDVTLTSGTGMAGAWTQVVGPVTSSTGTISNASGSIHYKKIGRMVTFNVAISIVTNGTGAGNVNLAMPFPAAFVSAFGGRELKTTGRGLGASMAANSNLLSITDAAGNYAAPVDGALLVVNGSYEATS